jgi:hypothetical protein
MTEFIAPDIPNFNYLPSLCNANGCLKDPAPGRRYCWQHLRSREVKSSELREREKASQARRLNRVAPSLRVKMYAVGVVASDLIKFGVSVNPEKRLNGLQTANPLPLELIAYVGCDRDLEADVHQFCSEQRVRGEWFRRAGRAALVERLIIEGNPIAIYDLIGRKPPWSLT